MLTYLKENPLQEVQGQLFGMSQSNANQWIHLLHAVLNQALAHQELRPARTPDDLAVWLAAERAKGVPPSPLLGLMVRRAPSTARPLQRNRKNTPGARKSATRAKPSS